MKLSKLTFAALLLFASTPLALAQGTYTQIDVPGASQTQCWGINTAGDVTGSYETASGWHGFLLSGGIFTYIDFGTNFNTFLYAINDVGQIAGGTSSPNGFVYDIATQTFTDISYPGAVVSTATSINNAGRVAGFFALEHGIYSRNHGFVFQNNQFGVIVHPGWDNTDVWGEAESGVLVGNGSGTSFRFRQGTFYPITIPNEPNYVAYGINSAGTAITGVYSPSSGSQVGFIYQNQVFQPLQFPGYPYTYAFSSNASGVVAGVFQDGAYVSHGFTWTPPADAAKK
jgi:uncharacterized membrane protein